MFRLQPSVRLPVLAFMLISLGGLLLHVRIHPPLQTAFNWPGTVFPLVNLLVLPVLFNRSDTAPWAYLLTWVTVVTGTVLMAYHSVTTWKEPLTLTNVVLKSTLPDIIVLSAKLPLAHAVLHGHRLTAGAPATTEEGA